MKHREELANLFEENRKTGKGVEVGVQYGVFSKHISDVYKGDLYSVDIQDQPLARERLNKPNNHYIVGNSIEIAKTFKDNSLDFVYIDAGHSYEEVKADYEAWLPKVRKGGIVSGHDYGVNDCIGVKYLIDELIGKGQKFNFTTDDFWQGTEYQSWWYIK